MTYYLLFHYLFGFFFDIYDNVTDKVKELGRLVSVHHVSPASIQRAFITASLSLIFFVAMIAAFYVWQNILYFLMASGFLVVYLILMASLIFQRRTTLSVYENGFVFKKTRANWENIAEIDKNGIVKLKDRDAVQIPKNLLNYDDIIAIIRQKTEKID